MDDQLNILLMRHAKSSWKDRRLRDYDRPLNKRGNRDAPAMGLFLKNAGRTPDLIISSPALRAKTTSLMAAEEMDFDHERILWNDKLYFDGPDAYVEAIKQAGTESGLKRIMTVGHNPMTENTIALLTGRQNPYSVPTAAVICLDVNVGSWDELVLGCCTLVWIKRPKDL
ncbi:SixA phosphatase family protein [Rhodohalobacter mucosus]|uniref:Histidine phosphatase family protein n=1 Tax=Rhodohalobacter mucosus TaxID=2079485 RepID=A0A316TME8_9BACT|nr:histidine phosphatase family protein [Rhodohalobacter mucosus]PWN05580.1 histidine phosphatase family protein [Rhodohalobacter mucosus]